MKSSRIFLYLLLPLLVVSIIVCSAFGRTLGSYFLEDDFGEVLYVSQIFAGNWHKIISNFTGNYMEIPTMKVYRPCLLLSIIADYAMWRTNASGYFITNILFLIGSALMLYLVLIELTKSWYRPRAILFSLFSAALFAASPLHCESVSLMVGRVDIICAFFYLLALWCFIRKGDNHKWFLTSLGIISFWIALLTKEMAIGLPIVLTTICLLFSDTLSKQLNTSGLFAAEKYRKSIGHKLELAFNITYPLWISCAVYFIIRYFALGTFLGGYVGSVGANQFSHILEKWTDLDTISRIMLPLSKAVFRDQSSYHLLLFTIYILLFALIITKLIVGNISRRWLLLLLIWTATVLAPIYQLWGLGFNLEGARFLFFLTMPLAMIVPLLILSPQQLESISNSSDISTTRFNSDIGPMEIKMLIPAVVLLSSLVVLNTKITAKNNIPWIHAGRQTRALLEQGQYLAENLPADKKAIILGIPKEIDGAHVIYNGLTFNFIMSPPFSKKYYADKFITFDPILFGNPDIINTSRLKAALAAPEIFGSFVWQTDKMKFDNLELATENHPYKEALALNIPLPAHSQVVFPFTKQRGQWIPANEALTIQHCQSGSAFLFGPCEIDPFIYDFMEIEATAAPCLEAKQITVSWPNQNENAKDPSTWESKAIGLSATKLAYLQNQKNQTELLEVQKPIQSEEAEKSEIQATQIQKDETNRTGSKQATIEPLVDKSLEAAKIERNVSPRSEIQKSKSGNDDVENHGTAKLEIVQPKAKKSENKQVETDNLNSPDGGATTVSFAIDQDPEFKIYRIPLSRYWRWFTSGQIKQLYIEFSPTQTITIRNIRLVSDNKMTPKIFVIDSFPDNRGVYQIEHEGVNLKIDANQVANISAVKLEFSKPNYFFENFETNSERYVLSSTTLNNTSQTFLVDTKLFPGPGYYQIRAIGLRKDGQPQGEWSDPLTLKL